MQDRKFIVFPILHMLFIFILSSMPVQDGRLAGVFFINPVIANLLHMPLFGLLAFLWMRTFEISGVKIKKAIIYGAIITVSYAVLDEIHQSFVPGRFAAFSDVILDSIGCLLAVFVVRTKKEKEKCIKNHAGS